MTQGIRDFFDLPSLEERLAEHGVIAGEVEPHDAAGIPSAADSVAAGKPGIADAALAMVDGADHAEAMEKLHTETLKHAQDIMDLGFNIDHARAARMFEVAATMFGRAIEAKNSKRDAQLKAVRLALEQRKIELLAEKLQLNASNEAAATGNGTLVVEDRNELIKQLRAQMKDKGEN